jgi:hypothetical protein
MGTLVLWGVLWYWLARRRAPAARVGPVRPSPFLSQPPSSIPLAAGLPQRLLELPDARDVPERPPVRVVAWMVQLLTALYSRVRLAFSPLRWLAECGFGWGEKLAKVDAERMRERRQSICRSTLQPSEKQLLERVLNECAESVRQAREKVFVPSVFTTLALGGAWGVVLWFVFTLVRAIYADLGSPSATFFGSCFLIVPAVVVGVSIFRLLDMRWVELGFWIVFVSYFVAVITLGAATTGLDRGYISEKLQAGMTAASSALLFSVLGFIVGGLHSYTPSRALAREIRRGRPRSYIAVLLIDVLLAELRARDEPLNPKHWKKLRELLGLAAGAIQTALPYRLRRGHGPLDSLLMRECWRIAEALRWTELELLALPAVAGENRFQVRILESVCWVRAGWWGDLPRWPERPSLRDKWSAPFSAALPTLLILIGAAASSIYAFVGWKAGSDFFNAQGRVLAMVFSAVSLVLAVARGAGARQRVWLRGQ